MAYYDESNCAVAALQYSILRVGVLRAERQTGDQNITKAFLKIQWKSLWLKKKRNNKGLHARRGTKVMRGEGSHGMILFQWMAAHFGARSCSETYSEKCHPTALFIDLKTQRYMTHRKYEDIAAVCGRWGYETCKPEVVDSFICRVFYIFLHLMSLKSFPLFPAYFISFIVKGWCKVLHWELTFWPKPAVQLKHCFPYSSETWCKMRRWRCSLRGRRSLLVSKYNSKSLQQQFQKWVGCTCPKGTTPTLHI